MMGARLWLAMWAVVGAALPAAAQEMKPPAAAAQQPKAGQDEDPRAKAVREAYEEQLRRERLEVTIKVRGATVDQIVEEFRRQTGWNIVVDRKNIPDEYRIDEFIVEKEPARRAFEAFAAKAELSIEDASATLIMLSRPPRLTFNFRDADIKVVIDMIARVSGANIIIAPDVKGTITLSINNVPWSDVLNAVVKTLNYTTVREAFGIIRVIHPDELLRQMEIRVFPLRYIQPPPTYTAKVESGKLIEGRPLTPATSLSELLNRFVLSKTLETVLSRSAAGTILGNLNFDPQTNVFIVRDTKVVLDRVAEIIKMLDVEPDQVVLDVKFISTSNRDLLQFGVNWALGDQQGITVTNSVLNPAAGNAPDGTPVSGKMTKLPFGLGHESGNTIGGGSQFFLTEFDMTMTFRAFKNDRYSKLVQEPTLTVVDNREATIFVGDTISYPEVRTVSNQFGGLDFSLTEAANSPVKVGFQLFIVPKIVTEVNKVILTVIPQNTFLSGSSPDAAVPGFNRFTLVSNGQIQAIDLPRVSETTVVSKMVVDNGRTAVLGGLVVERASYEDAGIPILKDLPIFSYLFKQRTDEVNKDHLLIFITPRIVRAGAQVSEGFQELLRIREESERAEFERMKKDASTEQKK
jgi:type IV pilus assembly protein PilQ